MEKESEIEGISWSTTPSGRYIILQENNDEGTLRSIENIY